MDRRGGTNHRTHRRRDLHRLGDPRLPRSEGPVDPRPRRRPGCSTLDSVRGRSGGPARPGVPARTTPPGPPGPNPGHAALVQLERTGRLAATVTQNIDGLHQQAGSDPARVIEVHGTIFEVECLACRDRTPMREALDRVAAGEEDPPCRPAAASSSRPRSRSARRWTGATFRRAITTVAEIRSAAGGRNVAAGAAGGRAGRRGHRGRRAGGDRERARPTPYDRGRRRGVAGADRRGAAGAGGDGEPSGQPSNGTVFDQIGATSRRKPRAPRNRQSDSRCSSQASQVLRRSGGCSFGLFQLQGPRGRFAAPLGRADELISGHRRSLPYTSERPVRIGTGARMVRRAATGEAARRRENVNHDLAVSATPRTAADWSNSATRTAIDLR